MRRALDIGLLQTLVAIADHGGFARAGERVNLSQPTVSQQMRRLEEQIGAVIFVRKGRTMTLTEEGLSLLRYARRMLALSDEAISAISATEISGPVRFGTIQDLTEELLSEILAHFSRSYPSARLEVTVGNSEELDEGIASGSLDLALLAGTPSKATPLFRREPLLWIAGENCMAPPDGTVPLVLCTEPCRLRQSAIVSLEAKGRSWRLAFTSPSISGVKAAVRAGLGITLRGTSFLGPGLTVIEGDWHMPILRPRHLNIVLGRTAKVPLSGAGQALESLVKKFAADQTNSIFRSSVQRPA
jgi:DNA-binding transcriptional LysR family regulator